MDKWISMASKDRRPKISRLDFERVMEIMQQWFVSENNILAHAVVRIERQLHMTRCAYSSSMNEVEFERARANVFEQVVAEIFVNYPELEHEYMPSIHQNLERLDHFHNTERMFPPNQLIDLYSSSDEES